MKALALLHRYLSCLVAPAMLFFAVSGIWQIYRMQESTKDGSYEAPWTLTTLSHIHKAEKIQGPAAVWFKMAMALVGVLFAATALVGIVMAVRLTKPAWLAWALLAAGTLVPAGLAIVAGWS